MKSTILNSLKTLTLTTALTGVIMASVAHAAITTAPVGDNISVQPVSEGQLFAAIKSDRDGTPNDGENHSDNNGHDNDDNDGGHDNDGDNDGGHDNDDGKDDGHDGNDSDGDGDDGEGNDSDGDGDD